MPLQYALQGCHALYAPLSVLPDGYTGSGADSLTHAEVEIKQNKVYSHF
jgi:hypothetical protein